jgi:hypothetical protein
MLTFSFKGRFFSFPGRCFTSYSFPHASITKSKISSINLLDLENSDPNNTSMSSENFKNLMTLTYAKINILEKHFNLNHSFNCLAVLVDLKNQIDESDATKEAKQRLTRLIIKNVEKLDNIYSVCFLLRFSFPKILIFSKEEYGRLLNQFTFLVKKDFDDQQKVGMSFAIYSRFLSENPEFAENLLELKDFYPVAIKKMLLGDACLTFFHLINLEHLITLEFSTIHLEYIAPFKSLANYFTLFVTAYYQFTWGETNCSGDPKLEETLNKNKELVRRIIQNTQSAYLDQKFQKYKKGTSSNKKMKYLLVFMLKNLKEKNPEFEIQNEFIEILKEGKSQQRFIKRDPGMISQILKFRPEINNILAPDS